MTNPYWEWRNSGGKRADEVVVQSEDEFKISEHSTEVNADLLPQTQRLLHRQLMSAGFETHARMCVARFREVLYVGTGNAGKVKRPEFVAEVFAVQGVKRAGGQMVAVQAHWLDGTFIGMYVHIPGVYHRELLTEWTAECKPLLDAIAPKATSKKGQK